MLGLGELGVRAMVKTHPETGLKILGRVALLPYKPSATHVQQHRAKLKRSTYIIQDSDLGWALRPKGKAGPYTANAQGLRAPTELVYTASVPPGLLRISVYGDSFTHGDNLKHEKIWPTLLQKERPGVQVLNFGMPGYGSDQAFLRFRRDGARFKTQVDVLGIWPEDLCRNLNLFRFYMTPQGGLGGPKPRFSLEGEKLSLLNQPIVADEVFQKIMTTGGPHALLQHEHWFSVREGAFPIYYHLMLLRAARSVYEAYDRRERRHAQYFGPDSEANRLGVAIASAFAKESQARGASPVIVFLPMRDFLESHGNGGFPLPEMLRKAGLRVLDLGPAFAKASGSLFLPDGHFSEAGNQLTATELAKYLAAEIPGYPKADPKRP